MEDLTRRGVIQQAIGGAIAIPALRPQGVADDAELARDRKIVIDCGMTEAEADCWVLTAKAAGKFFELPELHPADKQEVATAIHVIQNKLLGRPTYRRYRELHGAPKEAAPGKSGSD